MTVKELLQKYVNKSYDELSGESKYAVSKLLPTLNELVGKEKAIGVLISFICSCVAADGELSVLEAQLMNDILGVDKSGVLQIVRDFQDFDFANDVFDSCEGDIKMFFLSLCLCFIAVDEEINAKEIAFLEHLVRNDN